MPQYDPEALRFKTISDFKWGMRCGAEAVIEWEKENMQKKAYTKECKAGFVLMMIQAEHGWSTFRNAKKRKISPKFP